MNSKYENVIKILNGDMVGCINTSSEEEFCKICHSLNEYECFGDTIYMALIEQLAGVSERFSTELCYDNIVKVLSGDKNYGWAFAVADVLFPTVLSLCERREDNDIHQISGLYAFRLMDDIDIENISDHFIGRSAEYIKNHFSDGDMPTSEDVYKFIVSSTFLLPF